MNKQEGSAEKDHLATDTISISVADLRQIPQLGHTGKFGPNNFWIVRDIGPAITHDHDSMVEELRIFLQTLDPDAIATLFYTRLEMEGSASPRPRSANPNLYTA